MKVLKRHLNEAKTQKEFKQVLWIYDFWGRLTERKGAKKVLELASVNNGIKILDVACGTGEMLKKLIRQNPNGKNVGIDLSPDMIKKANEKLKKTGSNFELHEGNALHLNFSDNTFDLLINNYMVDLLPEEYFDKIASEFHRVLQPGGEVVISTFSFGTKGIHKFWFLRDNSPNFTFCINIKSFISISK